MLVKNIILVYNDNRGDYMGDYTVIVVIFGVFGLFIFVMIHFINCILQYKNMIDSRFVAIRKILDDRVSIVDDMILFLGDNLEHEKSYMKKLNQVREMLVSVNSSKEGILLIKKSEKNIFSFVELENTYKNLGKNKEYLKIKEELLNNKERLVYSFDSYDEGVIKYNNYRKNKLIYCLSKLCGIPEYDCYKK